MYPLLTSGDEERVSDLRIFCVETAHPEISSTVRQADLPAASNQQDGSTRISIGRFHGIWKRHDEYQTSREQDDEAEIVHRDRI